MLQQIVTRTIDGNRLIPDSGSVLIAVSGGVDSVVLLHLLASLGREKAWQLIAGHINHGLRGAESDGDEALVKNLAERLSLPFLNVRLDRSLRDKDGNRQARARTLRYQWLEHWADEHGCSRIATAHHADDQAETLLERLARGSGLDGLAGIPMRRERIIRPLLEVGRDEILEYARIHQLDWREDSSNVSLHYRRNRIRAEILPLLEEIVPGASGRIAGAAGRLAAAGDALNRLAEEELDRRLLKENSSELSLDVSKADRMLPGLRAALWRESLRLLLGASLRHIDAGHIDAIDGQVMCETHGGMDLPRGVRLSLSDNILYFFKDLEDSEDFDLALNVPGSTAIPGAVLQVRRLNADDLPETFNEQEAFFDADSLPGPLRVRNRRPSDRIRLPNLGEKLVSKLMSDLKLPQHLRCRIPLLYSKSKLLWVCGLRRSDLYKVNKATRLILGIKYLPRGSN